MDAVINNDTNIVDSIYDNCEAIITEKQTLIKDVKQEVEVGWLYDKSNKTFSKSNNLKFNDIRIKRDQLLKDSDYTQLPDSTYPSTQDAWKTYRQQLRDITKGVTDPDTIVFPEEPK